MHVMKPKCVGLKLTNRRTKQKSTLPIDRPLGSPFVVPRTVDAIANLDKLFRIVAVEVAGPGACSTGIFPFCFCLQSPHPCVRNRRRGMLIHVVKERCGVIPCDIDNWMHLTLFPARVSPVKPRLASDELIAVCVGIVTPPACSVLFWLCHIASGRDEVPKCPNR